MSPTAPRVVSVNVATPHPVEGMPKPKRTAIDKRPVRGAVAVRRLGLEGDQVGNPKHHGGVDQAVYAFAAEDLAVWGERLGADLRPGMFGENLTTEGLDVNAALVGERWRIGTALLEVCSVRIPCTVFARWLGANHLDNDHWVRRFTEEGRPGPYLRVIEEGELAAGDPILVESRPDHDVTIATMFRALTTDRTLLPGLLKAPALPEEARRKAERAASP